MIPIFKGIIEKGKIHVDRALDFKLYLCKLEGKEIEIIVKRKSRKRTNPENSYYWAVVVKLLSEELGYTQDEMNEVLKQKFLPIRREPFDTCGTFAKLTTIVFEEKMSEIREFFGIELNIYIPLPNEIMNEVYNESNDFKRT